MSKYVKMIQNASPRTDLGISWQACTTTCKTGYTPSEKKLDCYAQVLTPRIFECLEDPCPIPFAKNQEGSGCLGVPGRVDGTVIESGETCRTECLEGFLSFFRTNLVISSHKFDQILISSHFLPSDLSMILHVLPCVACCHALSGCVSFSEVTQIKVCRFIV